MANTLFILLTSALVVIVAWVVLPSATFQFRKMPLNNTVPARTPLIDLSMFHYSRECSTLFKYRSASPRDLLVYSYSYSTKWEVQQHEIEHALTLMRLSMPNITSVVFTTGIDFPGFKEMMQRFNVTIIRAPVKYDLWNAVNARIPLTLDYLIEHYNDYERVIWSDLRDVFIFTDVMRTISDTDLFWLAECTGKTCYTFYNRYAHFTWMTRFESKKEVKRFIENDIIAVNGGLGMGGITPMTQLLRLWNQSIEMGYVDDWGYDQTILNKVVDRYKDTLHIQIEYCTQRMCFNPAPGVLTFTDNIVFYRDTGCSPIVTHKGMIDSWRTVYGNISVPEDS